MKKLYEAFSAFCVMIISPLVNLGARIYIGLIFWKSGLAKLDDMEYTIESFDPAEDGDFAISFLPPELAAYSATAGELILPVLLVLGLFTRVGAAGLLVMTAVIQFALDWSAQPFLIQIHYHWMIILAFLVAYGGNKVSLDNLLLKMKNP